MEVELVHGTTKAIVDPKGAYLTNLSDENGDLFYPRRNLTAPDGSVKLRGGCHVCLPNFGPGGTSGQSQHGFGRTNMWEVTDKTENGIILTLAAGVGEYKDLATVLTYQLADNMILMGCEVSNNGEAPLRVAPGFHPYFSLTGESEIEIDGQKELLGDLAEAQFTEGDHHELKTAARTFTMSSTNLPVWAKWTDQLGKYVCMEPTLGGFTFLKEAPNPAEILQPGESKTYKVSITWG
jgi:galactose mutarotase-like enzyme